MIFEMRHKKDCIAIQGGPLRQEFATVKEFESWVLKNHPSSKGFFDEWLEECTTKKGIWIPRNLS